ncbi:DUF3784 domain-containing protein [Ornithinibacillus halotolerans]|uniref:DUF3784 domain-containing protein n=1 Tax=Ornithinibacillus halotolerans TaxID=1274357 RepID=A0A916RX48_9BACI|nr:DUF3784 domain-containing protein [Ornithinibacillus halotolerans]GGA74531.1 hypothetical protein GCM10008025_17830 [Ornithinibacillus halotolerans]
MSKGMIIYAIVMGWTLIIYGGITYLIVKKKELSLISGFSNRPKDEQEYLKENGYIDVLGKIMLYSFYMLLLATILPILKVPYGMEIGFGLFTIFLLGGLMYLQKFEVPSKRKKMLWILGITNVIIIGFIGWLTLSGSSENEIYIEDDTFVISGMYGIEWPLNQIEEVRILEELPNVKLRKNGFSTGNIKKGMYKLEEPYGNGRLFIKGESGPYLYIAIKDDYVIFNRDSEEEVNKWFEKLMKK